MGMMLPPGSDVTTAALEVQMQPAASTDKDRNLFINVCSSFPRIELGRIQASAGPSKVLNRTRTGKVISLTVLLSSTIHDTLNGTTKRIPSGDRRRPRCPFTRPPA